MQENGLLNLSSYTHALAPQIHLFKEFCIAFDTQKRGKKCFPMIERINGIEKWLNLFEDHSNSLNN